MKDAGLRLLWEFSVYAHIPAVQQRCVSESLHTQGWEDSINGGTSVPNTGKQHLSELACVIWSGRRTSQEYVFFFACGTRRMCVMNAGCVCARVAKTLTVCFPRRVLRCGDGWSPRSPFSGIQERRSSEAAEPLRGREEEVRVHCTSCLVPCPLLMAVSLPKAPVPLESRASSVDRSSIFTFL